ncbi:dihydrofolate reductase family protein [Amycolatopsis sp. NPDC004625]|uniref:dihydrofolate reductase family protein n=1 Tax=Amycolatopsis sp. NPDC004625 TaxID=3154670 RepID=UPI0033BD5B05
MGKVIVDITVSLDGFIATPDDDVERLHRWAFTSIGADDEYTAEARELFEKNEFGAIFAGRRTYEVSGAWSGNPPVPVPYVILSHDVPEKVKSGEWSRFVFVSGDIETAMAKASEVAGGRSVGVMGGADVIQQCLKAGLVDELWLHVVPVLLGSGIRLFDHIGAQQELELVHTKEGPETFRMLYRVVR